MAFLVDLLFIWSLILLVIRLFVLNGDFFYFFQKLFLIQTINGAISLFTEVVFFLQRRFPIIFLIWIDIMISHKAIGWFHIRINKIRIKLLLIKTLMRALITSVVDGTYWAKFWLLTSLSAVGAKYLVLFSCLFILSNTKLFLLCLGYYSFLFELEIQFLLWQEWILGYLTVLLLELMW